ncbi:helix-turn-helix domain-containing protein [Vibrio diabolicus]|uniref:helix-turn-helix domain-containing protein n=1 Tax=Vibrio diabolicus TaxID=50719 RepID=UPI00211ACBA3|nr:helix-turn-helix domain-containing protein [Vibrio diabolicus]MCG6219239.1 helix-turn-helix domain-containing protein [Vibrio diabolicus]
MSVKVMSYVWDIPSFKGSDKLVMLCLADHADDSGICWPSIDTIARKSGVSPTTVKSTLKKLEKGGWLFKKNQFKKADTGRLVRSNNQYQLPVMLLKKKADEQTDFEQSNFVRSKDERSKLEQTKEHRGVGQFEGGGRSESGYKPPIDPPIEPSSKDLAPSEPLEAEPALFEIPLSRKGQYLGVTQLDIQEYSEAYPAVDIRLHLKRMILWCKNNPQKRKATQKGARRFIQNWLAKEQDKGRNLPPEQQPQQAKSDGDEIKSKVRQLEMDIDNENQHLLRVMNYGGSEQAIQASKNKIKRLSDERRELLDQLAEVDSDGGEVSWRDGFAA